MAMYSDLLFAVSGDPIDVRASIYEILKRKKNLFFKKTREILLIVTASILLSCLLDLRVLSKRKSLLCKHLFLFFFISYFTYIAL